MGLGGVGGSLGTYLGGCGGDGSGTAVHIRASSTASTATWYGVEVTWGLGRGVTGAGEVVGARLDEGGEGGGVSYGGWGEASSLRHFSASQSRGGDGGWSPNRRSSSRSPQPRSGNEGLEGTEESRLKGLDDMANCGPQWVVDDAWVLGQAQLKCLGQRRDGLDPRHTSSPQGGG